MERLTMTSNKGGVAFTFDLDITCKPSEAQKILKLAEKLKNYEEAEEQGLLLRLPCKVGDTVYLINHSICEKRKTPLKCVVDEFTFDKDNKCCAVLNGAMNFYAMRRFKAVEVNKFGLTVFLTQSEAEQALIERLKI